MPAMPGVCAQRTVRISTSCRLPMTNLGSVTSEPAPLPAGLMLSVESGEQGPVSALHISIPAAGVILLSSTWA